MGMNKALIYKTTTNLCCDIDKMKCFKIPKNFSQSSATLQNGFKILGDKLILAFSPQSLLKKSFERIYKLLLLWPTNCVVHFTGDSISYEGFS